MTDLDRMQLHIDSSFTFDARGRMLLSNEPRLSSRTPAPRAVLGQTPDGNVLRIGASVPDDVERQLEEIVASLPPLHDLQSPPPPLPALRDVLEQHAPVTAEYGGPNYHFPDPIPALGDAVQITRATVERARDTYPWLLDALEDWWPCFGVIRDGAIASVCFSSRVADRAEAAGVDTHPAYRQRGYAAAVTAAWGAAIRASGKVPFYSTSWDNVGSQGVARRVGLLLHGATTSWT
jgi:predicted GNAT family acetyltransferase